MTKTERAALVYLASVGGSALVSYLRGDKANPDWNGVLLDGAVNGVLWGTGANVLLYMHASVKATSTPVVAASSNVALPNAGGESCSLTGKLSSEGVKLLSMINPEKLYKAAKMAGMVIAPAPENPYDVHLPKE
jgi:hypothetical protein